MLSKKILEYANSLQSDLIEIRRHFHKHPELSFKEYETTEHIIKILQSWNVKNYTKPLETGIIGELDGGISNTKVVALRADIDALPIIEENEVSYKSNNEGVMHACGHDVHTTCLLGAIKILEHFKKDWGGKVKYIFQPGEERNPGGASLILKSNALENPRPESIFGLHVHPDLEIGKVGYRKGKCMASADEIHIKIKGKGGHAAAPHKTSDTILVAAQLIVQLQSIISRNNDPFNPSVLSICSIQGGHTTNVIPNEVVLMGTFRAMDETWRRKAHQLIQNHCDSFAQSMNVKVELMIDIGYPMVYNEPQLTEKASQWLIDLFGAERVIENERRMGGEDFGFYTQKMNGCFLRLGTRNEEKKLVSGVHTSTFDIDEKALSIGSAMMAWMAIQHNQS